MVIPWLWITWTFLVEKLLELLSLLSLILSFIFQQNWAVEKGKQDLEPAAAWHCTFQWMEEEAQDDGYGSSHIIAYRIKQAAVA